MAKAYIIGLMALAIATVGLNSSLRAFNYLMTFRASDFPAEMSRLLSPRVSINSLFSVMTAAQHLCVFFLLF